MAAFSTAFDRARSLVSGLSGGGEKPRSGEAGSDTEDWFGSFQAGGPDVNPELTGSAKFDVYDEMRKTDASVRALLSFTKLPVRAAKWGLNPAADGKPSEEPIALAVADFVDWNLGIEEHEGELDLSWDEANQQGLQICEWGPMFEELVWAADVVEWLDADGDPHLVRPLARLAPRYPRSIRHCEFVSGRVEWVEQNSPRAKRIPGDKLSYMVYEREGGRWDGVSLLRPAWGPWRLKKALMVAAGIGWDRFAMGLPIVWHPDDPAAEKKAEEIGRDVRTHERAYVRFPLGSGETRDKARWGMELANGSATLADPTPLLRQYSLEIARAGLAHFSELGNTETGSRAVADVQVDPFFLAVESLANYLRRERQRQVIKRIVAVNFSAEIAERYTPLLTVSKIQARGVQTIANSLASLHDAGFSFNWPDAIDDLCELLGLPKPPEDWEPAPVAPAGEGLGLPPPSPIPPPALPAA